MTRFQTDDTPACRSFDPEIWFPISENDTTTIETAKQICQHDCTLTLTCLEYALTDKRISGIWGGTTETQRASIHRSRARQAAKQAAL